MTTPESIDNIIAVLDFKAADIVLKLMLSDNGNIYRPADEFTKDNPYDIKAKYYLFAETTPVVTYILEKSVIYRKDGKKMHGVK